MVATRRQGFGPHRRRRPESSGTGLFQRKWGPPMRRRPEAPSRCVGVVLLCEELLPDSSRAHDYLITARGPSVRTHRGGSGARG